MPGFKKLRLLPSCLIAVAVVLTGTALLCLALTPLFLRGFLPPESGAACACSAAGIMVLFAVLLTVRLRGKQAMASAGIIGGVTVLTAALVCALGGKGFEFGPWLVRLTSAAAVGGLMGAVMSIRKRPGKRHKRRA